MSKKSKVSKLKPYSILVTVDKLYYITYDQPPYVNRERAIVKAKQLNKRIKRLNNV